MFSRRAAHHPSRRAAGHPSVPAGDAGDAPGAGSPELAGYRLVRVLGRGSRAVVHLGHPVADGRPIDSEARRAGDGSRTGDDLGSVAVKVYASTVSAESISDEAAALGEAGGEHVVRALDAARADGGAPCLILERLGGPSIAEVLSRDRPLDAGEALTIAASMLRAVARLWASGRRHTRLGPSMFRLDESGRPILLGLGRTVRVAGASASPAMRAEDGSITGETETTDDGIARLSADIDGFLGEIGARIEEGDRHRWLDPARSRWREDIAAISAAPGAARGPGTSPGRIRTPAERCGDVARAIEALEERLFRGVRPRAIDLSAASARDATTGGASRPMASGDATHRDAVGRGAAGGSRLLRDRLGQAARTLSPAHLAARSALGRIRSWVHEHRRPLILASAVAGILLAVTLSLVPMGASSPGRADTRNPSAATASAHAGAGDGRDGTRPTRAGGSVATPEAAEHIGKTSHPAEAGPEADPATAASALLSLRGRCLKSASRDCLESVDEPGSPQWVFDTASVADGGETAKSSAESGSGSTKDSDTIDHDGAGWRAELVQRTGTTALVSLAPLKGGDGRDDDAHPFSVLLIGDEDGWAIREIFG